MQVIPLYPLPSQSFRVLLGDQDCRITVYEKKRYPGPAGVITGPMLFMNIEVNGTTILNGVPCVCGVPIVIDNYLEFDGDLTFYDTLGTSDPVSSGLGTRWFLAYLP